MSQTLGQKLNNWWCVKSPGNDRWLGQVGQDDRGHAQFRHPVFSCRAACRILARYFERGARTLQDVFQRYAPESDTVGSLPGQAANNPHAYAKFVAQKCGISPFEPAALFDGDGHVEDAAMLRNALRAMAWYESNVEASCDVIGAGIALYEENWG